MRQAVLDCPEKHFPAGTSIPLLRQNEQGIVRLRVEQVAALMCCSFFSLFPFRHRFASRGTHGSAEMQKYAGMLPNFNLGFLFGVGGTSNRHKIRCLLEYFTVCAEEALRAPGSPADDAPVLVVEVTRHVVSALPNLRECTLPITKAVTVQDQGAIEDCTGLLEADFANKMLGGGVIGRGCVQEEIRFAINPEMFLARLVCEQLLPTEVVYMAGTRQYSKYRGYADSFEFAGRCPPPTRAVVKVPSSAPRPEAMHDVAIVALDATNYNQWNLKPEHQYFPQWVQRDIGKAAIAFSGSQLSAHPAVSKGPVVTGNWGCGAFGGDLELKFLQQLCAASAAGRPMVYYTFGKPELCEAVKAAHMMCVEAGMRVCDLYSTLLAYCDERVVIAPPSVAPPPDPMDDALQRASTIDYTATGTSPPQRTRTSPPATTAGRIRSVLEHLKREIDGDI
jgi:poly(ADP-ribose) glycohydrolase